MPIRQVCLAHTDIYHDFVLPVSQVPGGGRDLYLLAQVDSACNIGSFVHDYCSRFQRYYLILTHLSTSPTSGFSFQLRSAPQPKDIFYKFGQLPIRDWLK